MNEMFNFDTKDLDYSVLNDENYKLCEMSKFEVAFLCGMIKKYKPVNILEIGVSAGATCAIMFEAIQKYNLQSNIISCDINTNYYRNNKKLTGFRVKDVHGNNVRHKLITGNYLPEVIESFGKKFDFCILDTVHCLPGEVLDFLTVIPFLNDNAIIVLHDIRYYFRYAGGYATKLIFDSCVGQKFMARDLNDSSNFPNIGAIIINNDTRKYIKNIFLVLSLDWKYQIDDYQFDLYNKFYQKYYPQEFSDYFTLARNENKKYYEKEVADKIKMRFTLLDNYINYLKLIYKYKFNFDLIYDTKTYVWVCLPVSNDTNLHYEFLFCKNGVKICLHFSAAQKSNYIGLFDSKLCINLQEYETTSTKELSYFIDNIFDVSYIASIMNYLIEKTLHILINKHCVQDKIIMGMEQA